MGALAESIKGIKGGFAVTSCNISSATTSKKHGPPPVSFHRAPFQPSLQNSSMQCLDLVPTNRGLLLRLIRKQGRTCQQSITRCLLEGGGGVGMLPNFGPRQHADRSVCQRTWCQLEKLELRKNLIGCWRYHCEAAPLSTVRKSAFQARSKLSNAGQSATSVSQNKSSAAPPGQGSHTPRGAQQADRRAKMHLQKALAFLLGAVCFSSPCNAQGLVATTAPYAADTTSIISKNGPSLQIVSRAEQSLNKVTASARAYDPVDTRDRAAAAAFESRASNAVNLLSYARQAADAGRWSEALQTYSKIVAEYSDLALAAYARVGRALALYEVGDKGEAILELQDMSLELKGSPEVHAALAATLYHDKKQFAQAENQFAAATILDPRYNDLEWVQKQKWIDTKKARGTSAHLSWIQRPC